MLQSLVAKATVIGAAVILALATACTASASTTNVTLTFYGWPDNDPPNSSRIHHPGPPPRHGSAGGSGTYDNPTTVAVQAGRWPPGTRMYLPYLSKYLIVEDSCAGCRGNWIDVWVGGAGGNGAAVIACEHRLTPSGQVPVEIDPSEGKPVQAGGLC